MRTYPPLLDQEDNKCVRQCIAETPTSVGRKGPRRGAHARRHCPYLPRSRRLGAPRRRAPLASETSRAPPFPSAPYLLGKHPSLQTELVLVRARCCTLRAATMPHVACTVRNEEAFQSWVSIFPSHDAPVVIPDGDGCVPYTPIAIHFCLGRDRRTRVRHGHGPSHSIFSSSRDEGYWKGGNHGRFGPCLTTSAPAKTGGFAAVASRRQDQGRRAEDSDDLSPPSYDLP